jgi:predicted AAA+ superfamily ATPase
MAGTLTGIAERRVSALLDDLLQVEPVIALHGPRSVGKSTVLSALAGARGVPVLDLDELGTRDAVVANPQTAVATQACCAWTNIRMPRRSSTH